MNRRQKLVQQQFLNDEEKVIKRLKQVYGQSLKDINGKISNLDSSIAMLQKAYASIDGDDIGDLARAVLGSKKNFTPEEAQETLQSMIQSKVYQKKYQTALQKQVGGILDTMHEKEFKVVSDYLDKCYENGFIGTMFDLQGQGIPMCFPMDQEAMVRAVQLDSKISKGLYTRLGEDVTLLKKKITAQVSRGISTGMSFQQVAQQLAGYTNIGYNNAIRIARTEGHRIQVQSAMDACHKAKDKGADVLKQWDSTLDGATRESHQAVDGEIRELDKPFSNGLMFPGDPSGGAAEVINCRCALLQRAKWAMDEDELETLKERAEFFGLDKADTFDDYKEKYLKAAEKASEVKEIKNALDFGYGDFTQDDYNKWWDDYEAHNSGVHLSKDELKAINDYTEGGFIALNDVGRYSDSELLKKGYSAEDIARIRKKADMLDGALAKYDLDTDVVTHRFERDVSWLTGKGNDIADLESLIGKEYTAKGFTSSGMLPNRFRFTGGKKDAVHFEIITPKGTNGAFLSMSKKGENEFLYNRNTRFKILDGGERVIKESKLNIRTMQLEEVDVVERFLKVQVITDDIAEEIIEEVLENSVKSARIFVPATDKAEAIKYAKRFNVDADYQKYNLDVANSINETMSKIEDTFGSKALDQLHRIGTFPQGYSTRYAGAYVRASDPDLDGSLWLRNVSRKNSLEKLESVAKEQFEAGYWSTPEALHTIRHELGHAVHRAIETPEINAQLNDLRKSIMDERMKRHRQGDHNHKYSDWLSEYGMTNTKEFVAESVAEYLAGNPRETAAKVVEILIGGK